MTATVEMLLDSFQTLPEDQKHRVAAEILRWSASAVHLPLQDEELVAVADAIFLDLEADEAQNG